MALERLTIRMCYHGLRLSAVVVVCHVPFFRWMHRRTLRVEVHRYRMRQWVTLCYAMSAPLSRTKRHGLFFFDRTVLPMVQLP
jgi:hypothetical protein